MNANSRWPILLSLAFASTAAADPRWGLTWRAADGCIQAAELAEKVERALKRPLFGADATLKVDGYLAAEAAPSQGWRARITLVDASGSVHGTREVTTPEPSCRAIDERLVLVMMVMIDPSLAPAPFAPPPALEPPLPPPEPEPAPQPRVAPEPDKLALVHGEVFLGWHKLQHEVFYERLGRTDLRASLQRRIALRGISWFIGWLGASASAALLVSMAFDVGCTRFSGTPADRGQCLDPVPWLFPSGVAAGAVGVVALATAIFFPVHPTNDAEDQALISDFNAKLKTPLRIDLVPTRGGVTLVAAQSF